MVGVPREVKEHEYRVALTPAGVHELVRAGHEVLVERGAGAGSALPDAEYADAGARLVGVDDVWDGAELLLKVKEPVPAEHDRLRKDQVLFTYLHLAADRPLTEQLVDRRVTSLAYETVALPDGSLPLLAPMSEVAGRLAPQVGAQALLRAEGGRGVLLGGVPGTHPAHVVVLGAGVSGHERRRDRRRDGRARHRARPRPGQAARRRPRLPRRPRHGRVERLRARAGRAAGRPGHRGGARRRRPGARCW